MFRPSLFRAQYVFFILLAGSMFTPTLLFPVCTAEVTIGTIIDTVGMVQDRTTVSQGYGNPFVNGSASLFRDSTMTNGGSLTVTKTVSSGGATAETQAVAAQKVLRYDAGATGSHLAASENLITNSARNSDSNSSLACTLASGDSSGGNRSFSSSASLDIMSATTLQLTSRTRISSYDLQYSVNANTSLPSGNVSQPAIISTTFTYGSGTAGDMNRATDRTMVSGLFDLFTRAYHGGNGATIQAQTQGTGMVTSKTVAEHEYEEKNSTGQVQWTGTTVYAADLLTNGGTLDETRSLQTDKTTSSQRVVNYHANGSNSMQTQELVVAVKKVITGSNSSTEPGCVFAGGEEISNGSSSSYQSVGASSQIMGVDSAQISSTSKIDIGSNRNGSSPISVDYKADINSPVQFDASLIQTMADLDKDGKYEDLNGNGRQDMQDLVILFKNFEWLSKSSLSSRFDYNNNGHLDFADLILAFKKAQKR